MSSLYEPISYGNTNKKEFGCQEPYIKYNMRLMAACPLKGASSVYPPCHQAGEGYGKA